MTPKQAWIDVGLKALAGSPGWLCLTMISIVALLNFKNIAGSLTDSWKVRRETTERIRQKRVRFDEAASTRKLAAKKKLKQLPASGGSTEKSDG